MDSDGEMPNPDESMVRSVNDTEIDRFASFLMDRPRRIVLTGAGCSTESGIPDYRGPDGAWRHRKPIQFAEFAGDEANRRYYWARAFRGWDQFSAARPNRAHRALADLERSGAIDGVITQNVDGLHQSAGSRNVLELHGSNHHVVCLGCRAISTRAALQQRMRQWNREWNPQAEELRADGDAELPRSRTEGFLVPSCENCGGALKPDVVFFGESVPRERVDAAMESVLGADVLLVVGSSLAVWSGYRFARAAAAAGVPVAILNLGWTRADELASIKLERRCGEVLSALAEVLDGERGAA